MAHGGSSGGSYSPLTGFVFIFNLIVGAGALTIPHAFAQVGLVYGVVALSILALTSYVTVTFMIEAIAGVNALKKRRRELRGSQDDENEDNHPDDQGRTQSEEISTTEFMPLMEDDRLEKVQLRKSSSDLVYDFDLSRKVELAQMAHALFNRHGIIAFYSCVVVYLYGDLAIYAVAVPKSLREIVCPRPHPNALIWQCSNGFNSSELYRFFVVVFGLVLGPFTFGNVQKTRTLQFITTIVRHVSFGLMIILAVNGIARGEGRKVPDVIADEHPRNIATFFGVCIYSFMCHHSVPGLVAPITNMKQVGKVIAGAFLAVLSVYLTLCISATFRFKPEDVSDVYTLNFKNYPVRVVAYFLSLFPVCTLSANFPVICITLRENLGTLAHNIGQQGNDQQGQSILSCNSYALFALVPPLVVAFFTEDVSMLVGYTGAYAGLGIQWVVPASLVFCLRRQLDQEHSQGLKLKPLRPKNPFASPFSHNGWLYLTFTMSVLAIVTITLTHSVK